MTTDIKDVFTLTKAFGKHDFSEIVKLSCKLNILPVNLADPKDKLLIDTITKAMTNFLKTGTKQGVRYSANRANDAGQKMEEAIIEEMKKTALKTEKLGSSGYPDLFVELAGNKAYIELKTSAQKNKAQTHHRLFYFTSGKKLKLDSHHLLLQVQISEEKDKIWKVEYWQLRDIHNLKVGLKTEWNANNSDFDKTTLLSKG